MSDSRPIGVFDSGIGGLTVVKSLHDRLPNETIVYLGDTARVPYGPKSPETVQRYALELAHMLMQKNAKALIVACNTVSSVALPLLMRKFSVPVNGVIEPGARAALQATRNQHVGVIGTRATVRSGAYEKVLRASDNNVRVSSRACPLLVPLIEEGLLDDEVTDRVIVRYLEPLLADGEVHFQGMPIAIVVAKSEELARKAAKKIVVEIEPLEAVTDPRLAAANGDLIVPPKQYSIVCTPPGRRVRHEDRRNYWRHWAGVNRRVLPPDHHDVPGAEAVRT